MINERTREPNRLPFLHGYYRYHGRRSYVFEEQRDASGTAKTVKVTNYLTPIEITILTVVDYLQETDPRQPEVEGYSLIRQIGPDLTTGKSGFGMFYGALKRLREWGWILEKNYYP